MFTSFKIASQEADSHIYVMEVEEEKGVMQFLILNNVENDEEKLVRIVRLASFARFLIFST